MQKLRPLNLKNYAYGNTICNCRRRAADSIGLNIAEGSTGQSDPEQKRFLSMANRSALEVVACLMKAKRRKYIDEKMYFELYKDCEKLVVALQTFINKLK